MGSSLCKTCNPVFRGSSEAEDELFKFIQSYCPEVIRHFKLPSGLELDLFLPKINLAIEYNGLYWHSEKRGYPPLKHKQKTEEASSIGIKLIQIFEDEYIHKTELVKSRLLSALGINQRRIHARKTTLREVSTQEASQFLNENHMQGTTGATVKLGLLIGSDLISVMTFGKPRFTKGADWELIRFASARGVQVVGGASKLLSAFKSTHTGTLISYADRRWSDGKLYKALGFTHVGTSAPSYWYFKGDLRENRMSYQKAKLSEFPNYDKSKTEVEIMFDAGWNRIWDCGNLVYELRL
jgi:hypothetical protein